jgi:D-alanyl-D-alanine carboxypeptidase
LLGGTEDRFAQMMTLRARALGMSHTTFTNASGLPDPDEWTTARDLAMLARHILTDFPGDYHYFSTPSFVFRGSTIFNHDGMLRSYPGADGMKTGYTEASGHNLITSAVRDGVRLIGVELGAGSNAQRDIRMTAMLNQGYGDVGVPIDRRSTQVAGALGLISAAHAATIEAAAHRLRAREDSTPVRLRAASAPVAAPVVAPVGWAVQVGIYAKERMARAAVAVARRLAEGGEPRVEQIRAHGRLAWRAQLTGMTAPEAQGACATLSRHRTPCLVLHPEAREVASR